MDYTLNDIGLEDPNFKFSRIRNGYSPEEVDVVIDTQKSKIDVLARQNNHLIEENNRQSQILNECNAKIQQLAQNTQLMEQERQKEKLRLANVMTTAGRTAEETVAEARQKAAEIIADANRAADEMKRNVESDARAAFEELEYLMKIINTARESSNAHFDRLDEVLHSAAGFIAAKQGLPH